jgi:hypothetical protein
MVSVGGRLHDGPLVKMVAVAQLIECGYTGSLAFLGGPEFPPIDTGAVRQMLSDFP